MIKTNDRIDPFKISQKGGIMEAIGLRESIFVPKEVAFDLGL
jgi:hypothetical protein